MLGLSLLSVGNGMPWWEYEAAMVDDGCDGRAGVIGGMETVERQTPTADC